MRELRPLLDALDAPRIVGDAARERYRRSPSIRAPRRRAACSLPCEASASTATVRRGRGRARRGGAGRRAASSTSTCRRSSSRIRAPRSRGSPTRSTIIRRSALIVFGVTGTNGKTTTTYLAARDRRGGGPAVRRDRHARRRCSASARWALENTTPLALELHRLLAEMRDAGARAVAMEVSSHALALGRVDDVRFRAAALTNVTRDHLDFHGTLGALHRGEAPALRSRAERGAQRRRSGRPHVRRRIRRPAHDVRDRSRRASCARRTSCCRATARASTSAACMSRSRCRAASTLPTRSPRSVSRAPRGIDDDAIVRGLAAARARARTDGADRRVRDRRDRRLRAHARRARERAARGARNDARPADRGVRLRRRSRSRQARGDGAHRGRSRRCRHRHLRQSARRGSGRHRALPSPDGHRRRERSSTGAPRFAARSTMRAPATRSSSRAKATRRIRSSARNGCRSTIATKCAARSRCASGALRA